ncbi:condensation domain-containing protein [Rhizobium sp. BK251]|uniref:condensation domain-containing protein n=1 Tax=Rhizobium sp. BK251 TaxID=2512125 RepID=UPI00104F75E0|nr:condensation domain-containing protein [Rhizobium sp. BK251]TCL71148.1 condensation domain-containing protein [Rhizobium sp. BK251]
MSNDPSTTAYDSDHDIMPERPDLVRQLGGFERVLHHYSLEHPRHFCMVAEIMGRKSQQDYRDAFDEIQRRHALLSVYIADDPTTGPGFYKSERPLKVTFTPFAQEPDWRRVVERELATSFPASEAPLMRATVLHGTGRATIVLTFHHSIGDGLSAAFIIQDLMEALDKQYLPPLAKPDALETVAGKRLLGEGEEFDIKPFSEETAKVLRSIAAAPLWRPFEGDAPQVSTVSFDPAFTSLLRDTAKSNGTTVHGAICAAVVCSAGEAIGKDSVTITSAVNLRTVLSIEERVCALLAIVGTVRFPRDVSGNFWKLARQATEELAHARTAGGLLNTIGLVESNVPPTADHILASGLFGSLQYDVIATNLGVLSIPTEVGDLRLESLWGPCIQGRFANERVIGAATINGQLRIVQTTPKHIPSFLDKLRQTLVDACA